MWTIRHPTLDDVPEILAVIHASDIAAVGEPDFTADEVVEILAAPNHDPARDSWLALDGDGRIVGWAYIWNPTGSDRENFDAYVHPEHGRAAHPYLLDLILGRIAERAREAGRESVTARGGVIASETAYVAALTAAGFHFLKRYARMRRPLTGEERPPVVPDGVTVRPLDHENEAELRAFHDVLDRAFRDTPDYQASDFATFQARLAALPTIDWDEWFVAEVDGGIAAVLQSTADGGSGEGWVKNVGVAKEFRGRGLGRLLLEAAFATYAAKGRHAAGLGVDLTNPTGAYRLYESVGMHVVYESDVYERTVEGAA
jgi:ribosomal protein S18 acetylase RimI-like enzyme